MLPFGLSAKKIVLVAALLLAAYTVFILAVLGVELKPEHLLDALTGKAVDRNPVIEGNITSGSLKAGHVRGSILGGDGIEAEIIEGDILGGNDIKAGKLYGNISNGSNVEVGAMVGDINGGEKIRVQTLVGNVHDGKDVHIITLIGNNTANSSTVIVERRIEREWIVRDICGEENTSSIMGNDTG